MEAFFNTHKYLVEHTDAPVRRALMDEIDWSDRLIGIKGTRGVGKTTFLLQYAKENFGADDRKCLYVNMNNFYFQGRGIADFAADFYNRGGEVLLIDQVFKQPDWSRELRMCYDNCPGLKIVFTGSSLPVYSFDDILEHHVDIATNIIGECSDVPEYFLSYLHHGFYPFFLEHRNFEENLLKTMNMMTEVDILLIKQIELKYLTKIKKLFYLLALDVAKAPNISNLAHDISTSRATVMNYIKYLSDARLINMIYNPGDEFPKKPAKIMMHNPNLLYAIYPIVARTQEVMETFFVNTLWKDHKVHQAGKDACYIVDDDCRCRIVDASGTSRLRNTAKTIYAEYNTPNGIGYDNHIPLWLFGLLY